MTEGKTTGRVNAMGQTHSGHRAWTLRVARLGTPGRQNPERRLASSPQRPDCNAARRYLTRPRRRPVRATTSTIGCPCRNNSTALTTSGGVGNFHLWFQYSCR